jgi:epoxyqueuosine reductase
MENQAQRIKDRATRLGYEKCGIIKVADVADYAGKLKERMLRVFLGPFFYAGFKRFAAPQKKYPWAKSIIILARSITNYNQPGGFDGMYGKLYMFNDETNENCDGWKARQNFKVFLESEGIKCENEPETTGVTGLRWAAYKAGIGGIRRNNFFYSENSGSYCSLEAWLIDSELELKEVPNFKACPESCRRCIDACPTKSLKGPYTMSPMKCAAFITNYSAAYGLGNTGIKTAAKFGRIVCGCDLCQDACPFNSGKHTGGSDFPGLDMAAEFMRPEKIMVMTYDEIYLSLASKYHTICKKHLWKWKLNALTYMMNNYNEGYREYIGLGLRDSDRRVRIFADKVLKRQGQPPQNRSGDA